MTRAYAPTPPMLRLTSVGGTTGDTIINVNHLVAARALRRRGVEIGTTLHLAGGDPIEVTKLIAELWDML